MRYPMLVSIFAVCASVFATAKDDPKDARVVADTSASFETLVTQVRGEMAEGGRYEFMSESNKAEVNARLDEMSTMLKQRGAVAQMREDEKVKLFNDQEKVNGLLTQSDSTRLICTRVAPVGSHIPVTTCKTYGELAQSRRDVSKYMRQKSGMLGCGGESASPDCGVTGPDRLLHHIPTGGGGGHP